MRATTIERSRGHDVRGRRARRTEQASRSRRRPSGGTLSGVLNNSSVVRGHRQRHQLRVASTSTGQWLQRRTPPRRSAATSTPPSYSNAHPHAASAIAYDTPAYRVRDGTVNFQNGTVDADAHHHAAADPTPRRHHPRRRRPRCRPGGQRAQRLVQEPAQRRDPLRHSASCARATARERREPVQFFLDSTALNNDTDKPTACPACSTRRSSRQRRAQAGGRRLQLAGASDREEISVNIEEQRHHAAATPAAR